VGATWFNQPYLGRVFQKDENVILFGRVGRFGRLQFQNPDYEKIINDKDETIHSGRITPVYPLVSGLYQRGLRQSLWTLIDQHLDLLQDFLPPSLSARLRFLNLRDCMREIHFPSSTERQKEAKRRLIFDEFFLFELNLLNRIQRLQKNTSAYPVTDGEKSFERFSAKLPFVLTPSQKQAIQEIFRDLSQTTPMARLLQGDVGSGKTAVAACAFQAVRQAGYQAVFLAPTETLAEQHFLTLRQYFTGDQGNPVLLTGSVPDAEKKKIKESLREGTVPLVIGTHALLQEGIVFKNLALVVIDEQHKFGVKQRTKLLLKERRPHVLFMTATPIPRTLALTLYGDLHSTVIRELPAGRRPIQTLWVSKKEEPRVFDKVREHLKKGEQGYFIYPAIEETEKSSRVPCEKDFERIQKLFPDSRIGLLHGRLETALRAERMEAFRQGEIQILAATSVIEVGIDNPRATFMVIHGAEYFGLSQLHQIRGRIGRGKDDSTCFLIGEPVNEEAQERFKILTQTQDGFRIAEEDLKLRGPGDFLGTRQSGLPLFRLANLITDQALLETARQSAHEILEEDTELAREEHRSLKKELLKYDQQFSD
jgi:ATP-dependent DNA helicase RecG